MSKHTISGMLILERNTWDAEPRVFFSELEIKSSEYADRAVIGPHEFTVEVSDDFDPTAAMISTLEEKKKELRLTLAAELAALDSRISKLQALPMAKQAA